jgi:ubiquinone/menaquinone biosynthesis C-methylase UbiE
MTRRTLQNFDILQAKKALAEGLNVTELLRNKHQVSWNTPEIIEVAYDLQSGAYIDKASSNAGLIDSYCNELATLMDAHVGHVDSLLDVGTGEITILSGLIRHLANAPERVLAFDISWSRIYKGSAYATKVLGPLFRRLTPFVAEMGEIPLPDKSVSVTTSNHALEPNGGQLEVLMAELFRVTRDKLVLFEPCYEMNTEEEQRRMDRLGYIKNVDAVVAKLGGRVESKLRLSNLMNHLNPTVCFVITPPLPGVSRPRSESDCMFSVPGTNFPLQKNDGFYFSNETGLCFPSLLSIPILKSGNAILATALSESEG